MSCLIGAANVKIFGKAFHALVRIADDLYIEALPTGLVFHTVNSSKSAYACFTFKPDFFITYKEDSVEKRKVLLKSCLMAFRSLPNLEKSVEKCLFDLTAAADYLLLKFFCKHGMIKTYQLHYVDNETVQGSFPTSGFLCQLNASSRLLQDGIQNFSTSVEEVTMTVCSNKVILRNYVDDEPDPNKIVHTELTLESEEFDLFEVDQQTKITFCLKELKKSFNVPVSIKCQTGGRPVTFSVTGLRGVVVQFVLATLADRETQSISSSGVFRNSVAQTSQFSKSSQLENEDKKKTYSTQYLSDSSQANSFSGSMPNSSRNVQNNPKPVLILSDDDDDLMANEPIPEEMEEDVVPSTPPHKRKPNLRFISRFLVFFCGGSSAVSFIDFEKRFFNRVGLLTLCSTPKQDQALFSHLLQHFRSMFLGLSSQATYTTMAPDPDEVLVANSDDEHA
ncbi:cell cycle checkpoint control protein RAD9A [Caerostris extrusa]|uniref:Cell cycle checkpoint control protein n=1 Tax=Caerostris extrusa TaxID=172846 RepID=A0AAV4RMJ3_CAEEX|nr:cell cycle checkpoint control protein RAD9A [Caerostris extrusa]